MPDLAVSQESAVDGSLVICLRGELDIHGAGTLQDVLAAVAVERSPRVVLDCAQLTFVDSTGLGAILGATRELNRWGGELAIACENPTVLRLFALTGIDEVVPVEATRARALARVSG